MVVSPKSAIRLSVLALAAGLLSIPAAAQIGAQTTLPRRQQPSAPRHETNAGRQARIARNIAATYSNRWEIGGGGGYLRFRSGDTLKRNNEISWNAFTDYYLSPKLSVIGTAQGSFGNGKATTNNQYGVYNPQINEYFFMGGANYRFLAREKVALSVQGQGGIGWGIFSGGSKGIPGYDLGLWKDGVRPAFSASLNADYNFFPNFAFRVSPTWIGTTFASGPNSPSSAVQSNLGINIGLLYRFGKR